MCEIALETLSSSVKNIIVFVLNIVNAKFDEF